MTIRAILFLVTVLVAACSSDAVTGNRVFATRLAISPAIDTTERAGTQQFDAAVTWSDGLVRYAAVTFSATGGTISPTGLFVADTVVGTFLVVATCLCGVADTAHVTVRAPPIAATALTLDPPAAIVDTGGAQQFQATVSWSDGVVRSSLVTFTATGGTISPMGLFQAASMTGEFRVIATCDCGVADTAAVTVTTTPVTVRRLTLSPSAVTIDTGGTQQFTAAVSWSDSMARAAKVIFAASGGTISPTGLFRAGPLAGIFRVFATRPNCGVSDSAQVTVNAVPSPPIGLPPHPRVWMDATRLQRLRSQVANNTSRWQSVKTIADGQVAKGSSYVISDANELTALCAAYLGTGQQSYATRAGLILTNYAVDANNSQGDSGYGLRVVLPAVTIGLDWCYEGLTAGQRHQAATWLMNRADWIWPQSTPSRLGSWGTNDPGNNYWWGFMMTGPAALAAAGDDTLSGAVSGADRPVFHRQLALTKWTAQALPMFVTDGAGGAWQEGTNYDSSQGVGWFADAFLTSGTPLTTPWFQESLLWRMHSTMPGAQVMIPLGDQSRYSSAPLYAFDRLRALDVLPAANASPTLVGQIQFWLNLIDQVPHEGGPLTLTTVDEFARYNPATPAASDLSGLPLSYLAAGAGVFIDRTSWTDPNATVMVFESGSNAQSHRDLGTNNLRIWRGPYWITSDANIYSHSGIEQGTRNYNTLTVSGTSPAHLSNAGQIISTQVSGDLVVVRGQARHTYDDYRTFATPVTDYLRTVAFLPTQNVFVVVDRVTVQNPDAVKTWRWHAKDVPTIAGRTFRLTNPGNPYSCLGSVLTPGDAVLGTETYSGTLASSAVTVSMSGRASDILVTVLQCSSDAAPAFVPSLVLGQTEATVTLGSRVVTIPLDEAAEVVLR